MTVIVQNTRPWRVSTVQNVTKIEEVGNNYVITAAEEHTYSIKDHMLMITK